jgi:hypothetical protein
MEPGYMPAAPEPDLTVIQRLMGLPQTLRAVGQNLAVGAASLPYGIYQGFGNPAAGEAAMSQFQQEYGYTPTNPAAQQQLRGLGEFLQQLETEYKIPPIMAPVAATPALGIRGMVPQTERLARDLVSEIQTTPPTGAVQLAPTPGLLEKSDIGFYSQLEAAVQPLQNKGTGQQYLAQIQKSAGVKPEEIQWTGLDEFLKSKQSVTKQEIQDYLQANRVDVQEVRLGSYANPYPYRDSIQWQQAISQAERAGDWDESDRLMQAWEASEGLGPAGSTKFSQYTLPGGENYREILLTLPQKNPEFDPADLGRLTELSNKTRTPAETEEYRALAQRYDASLRGETTPEYRSTHYDQPNILAHMRVNDRVVDGKKTLFVEEIQSDWHQAGRKKGYADRNKPFELFDPVTAEIYGRYATPEEAQAAKAALPEDQQYFDIDKSEGVPDAPFKTSWHELSLKRAIQEAAEKGYDQIAFTTGKTQAERYDLSKQVDTLRAPYDNGEYVVSFIPKGGNEYEYLGRFTKDRLSEAVGKDLAEKIIANKDVQTMTYKSEDLAIGGEGMKGFYDNILPKSLDKLGKKFNAKVGKTDMDGVEVWQMDITPQMRESVTTKGQPLFAIPAIGAGLLGAGMMQEEETY